MYYFQLNIFCQRGIKFTHSGDNKSIPWNIRSKNIVQLSAQVHANIVREIAECKKEVSATAKVVGLGVVDGTGNVSSSIAGPPFDSLLSSPGVEGIDEVCESVDSDCRSE